MFTDHPITPLGQLSRLGLWTALSGLSLGLFLWQILHTPHLESVLLHNQVDPATQRQILIWIGGATISLALGVSLLLANGYREGLRLALQSFAVLFLLPALFMKGTWAKHPLTMMLLLALVLLFSYYFSKRWSLPRYLGSMVTRVSPQWSWYLILALMVLGYTVYFSYYTILRHYQLESQAYDLGVFENTFLQTLKGDFLNNSHYGNRSLFSHHFSPIFALWYPFYYWLPTTETLLTLQSAFVASSAIPLFFLARLLLRSNPVACLITFCYLIHPANHGANFYDVHEMASFPIFGLALFYFLEKRQSAGYWIVVVLALAVKEDIALLLILIAVFIAIHKRQYGLALGTSVLSIAWYIGAQEIIILSGGDRDSGRYAYYYQKLMLDEAAGTIGIVKTLLTNPFYVLTTVFTPKKLLFVCQMCLPLLFLPLFRRRHLWLLAYGAAITLLATRSFLFRISFQYTWYILPMLFVAALYTLSEVKEQRFRRLDYSATLQTLLLASFLLSWQYGAIFYPKNFVGGFRVVDFTFDDQERERLRALRSLVRGIPETASVAGSENLVPHIPVKNCRVSSRNRHPDADYLVVWTSEYRAMKDRDAGFERRYAVINSAPEILLMKKRAAL